MPAQQVLKNFALFVDGRVYAGECDEVNLPKLTVKTEEFRAGGMDVPLDMDMGMEKLELSFSMVSYAPDILQLMGAGLNSDVSLTFRGALVGHDNPLPQAMLVVMRGRLKEHDPGTHTAGGKPALKFTASLSYYSLTINGIPCVTIDVRNLIRQIGSVDHLAAIRSVLGI